MQQDSLFFMGRTGILSDIFQPDSIEELRAEKNAAKCRTLQRMGSDGTQCNAVGRSLQTP
jgi:hypothetical protein